MSEQDYKTTPPWLPIETPSAKLSPSGAKLRAVIADLDVENAPRYRKTGSATWCNIFVTDVLTQMGLQPGHWMRKDGAPAQVGKGQEMNANAIVRWLEKHGPRFGWQEADRESAQAGSRNFVGETIRAGFGDKPVRFFVQMHGGSHEA